MLQIPSTSRAHSPSPLNETFSSTPKSSASPPVELLSQYEPSSQKNSTNTQKCKIPCPGCGREFVSLNGHLAKASGPCAEIRAQRLIASTPTLTCTNPNSAPIPSDLFDAQDTISTSKNDATNSSERGKNNEILNNLVQEASKFAQEFARIVSLPTLPYLSPLLNALQISYFLQIVNCLVPFIPLLLTTVDENRKEMSFHHPVTDKVLTLRGQHKDNVTNVGKNINMI